VYYNDIPVGTVCARLEKGTKEEEQRLYLMTMGILAVRSSAALFYSNSDTSHLVTVAIPFERSRHLRTPANPQIRFLVLSEVPHKEYLPARSNI
jgi:hypothetical protein